MVRRKFFSESDPRIRWTPKNANENTIETIDALVKIGDSWYDEATNQLNQWDGTRWVSVDSAVTTGILNVKDPRFGAKGDGVTDDSAAIQAALNAVPTAGGIVYLPRGTYKLSGASNAITMKADLILAGESMESTILDLAAGSTMSQVIYGNAAHRCVIENLYIKANRRGTVQPIKIDSSNHVITHRVRAEGNASGGSAMALMTCDNGLFESCLVTDMTGGAGADNGGGIGFGMLAATVGTRWSAIRKCRVVGGQDSAYPMDGSGIGNKLLHSSADRSGLSGVTGAMVEIDITSASGESSTDITVANCTFVGTKTLTQGIRINDISNSSGPTRVKILDNDIDSVTQGVNLTRSSRSIIRGNTIRNCDQQGIALVASSSGKISGNMIEDVSTIGVAGGPFSGIELQTNSVRNRIFGNHIELLTPATYAMQQAINLISGGFNVLKGNVCRAAMNHAILLGTPNNVLIGNECLASVNFDGIALVGSTDNLIVGNHCTLNARYGINIADAASTTNTVENNYLLGNTIGPLSDSAPTSSKISGNRGYNPQGVAAITVGASPFPYTNNDGVPEAVYIRGGTVSDIAKNATTIFTGTPATVWLEPGEACVVTYTIAPTMLKDRK